MSDNTQAGCFSPAKLLGFRRRVANSLARDLPTVSAHVATRAMSSHGHTEKAGVSGPCRPLCRRALCSSLNQIPDSVKHTFASCCSFIPASAHGDDIWRQDVDAPPVYRPSAGTDDVYRPEVMKTIENTLDELDPVLRELSLKIHGAYV